MSILGTQRLLYSSEFLFLIMRSLSVTALLLQIASALPEPSSADPESSGLNFRTAEPRVLNEAELPVSLDLNEVDHGFFFPAGNGGCQAQPAAATVTVTESAACQNGAPFTLTPSLSSATITIVASIQPPVGSAFPLSLSLPVNVPQFPQQTVVNGITFSLLTQGAQLNTNIVQGTLTNINGAPGTVVATVAGPGVGNGGAPAVQPPAAQQTSVQQSAANGAAGSQVFRPIPGVSPNAAPNGGAPNGGATPAATAGVQATPVPQAPVPAATQSPVQATAANGAAGGANGAAGGANANTANPAVAASLLGGALSVGAGIANTAIGAGETIATAAIGTAGQKTTSTVDVLGGLDDLDDLAVRDVGDVQPTASVITVYVVSSESKANDTPDFVAVA